MNTAQRWILKGALVALIATFIFPPFQLIGQQATDFLGFGFLFDPPIYDGTSIRATVNIALLLVEWVFIAIVSGILWALVADKMVAK